MTDRDPLFAALKALNAAAYDAIKAGRDTTRYPDLHRQMLREIAGMTDDLVDCKGDARAIDAARERRVTL